MRGLFLFIFFILSFRQIWSQNAGEWKFGQLVRHHWQHTYNRLIEGGDGKFYLFQNREGSFWNFGQGGVGRGHLLVFDGSLNLLEKVPIRSRDKGGRLRVLEAFPVREGIAMVALEPWERENGANLLLCRTAPGLPHVKLACDTLLSFPKYNPALQLPRLRLVWNQDKTRLALAWRNGTDPTGFDNNLGILVLDSAMKPQGQPFYPLTRARADVEVVSIAWAAPEQWLFHLRAFSNGNQLGLGQTKGQVIARFDPATQTLDPVALGKGLALIDLKMMPSEDGEWRFVGIYADSQKDPVEAGLFQGRWAGEDSIRQFRRFPFAPDLQREFIFDKVLSRDASFRSLFYNRLLQFGDTLIYVVNPRGSAIGVAPRLTGKSHSSMLMSWEFRGEDAPVLRSVWGMYHDGRTDYWETFSWSPIFVNGGLYALTNDFSGVLRLSKPVESEAFLLPLREKNEPMQFFQPEMVEPFGVMAPRTLLHARDGSWVVMLRSQKWLRLVRFASPGNEPKGTRLEADR